MSSEDKVVIVIDIRKLKEKIKEQKHKNDTSKIVAGGVTTAAVTGGAGVVATSTATVVTGASLGSITIGGSLGSWLVAHGILGAATVSTTVFSIPVFLGLALPAIGLYSGYNVLKNHQANKLLEDFFTTANIDSLGEKIAEAIYLPVIYFLHTMGIDAISITDFISNEMIKNYGFSEAYTKLFLETNTGLSITELKNKIQNQDVSVLIVSSINGKQRKSKELKLSFLREKSLKICKECLNKSCFNFDESALKRGKKTIKYIKTVLFKKSSALHKVGSIGFKK